MTARGYLADVGAVARFALPMLLGAALLASVVVLLPVVSGQASINAQKSLKASALPPLPVVGRPDVFPDQGQYLELDADKARAINAEQPFSNAPNRSAAPFAADFDKEGRERAISCMAIAALYEAGGKADDQYPVMQVILNRVRHPAFPNTICGVVFEGSDRATGCQFSFTCDGSLQRWSPSPDSVARARERAAAMLDGYVDRRVGLATHYHTDWVVPYWSKGLDKIVAVRTHLFFRWRGFWGTPQAFRRVPKDSEPLIPAMASWTPSALQLASAKGEADDGARSALTGGRTGDGEDVSVSPTATGPDRPRLAVLDLTLDAAAKPGRWALDALALCQKRPDCRAVGWLDPGRRPAAMDAASLSASPPDFVFVQQLRNRVQQPYWDCRRWAKASTSRCIDGGGHAARLVYGG